MKKRRKIVGWFSRNNPLPAQQNELNIIFNTHVLIVQFKNMYRGGQEIVKEAIQYEIEHAVIVAPLSMIQHVLDASDGIVWLYAKMDPVHDDCVGRACENFDPSRDVVTRVHGKGKVFRHQRFKKFMKFKKIEIKLEPFP